MSPRPMATRTGLIRPWRVLFAVVCCNLIASIAEGHVAVMPEEPVQSALGEGSEVLLSATSSAATCDTDGVDQYFLEFEVRPTSESWTGTPTHRSQPLLKSTCVAMPYPPTPIVGLSPNTTYRWRVRERLTNGSVSNWVEHGDGGGDFTTGASAPARLLRWSMPASSVDAGSCTEPLTIQHEDASGNPQPVVADLPVTLWSRSAGTTFYLDAGCTTPVTELVIPAGTSQATVHLRNTLGPSTTIVANAAQVEWGQLSLTLNPGPATRLAFVALNRVHGVEECSSLREVELQDEWGNSIVASSTVTVALSSASPGLEFHSNASCSSAITSVDIPVGSARASLYFRSGRPGRPDLRVETTGLGPGTQRQTVLPLLATTTPSRTVAAGECAATTLERRDASGMAWAGDNDDATVWFFGGSTVPYADADCTLAMDPWYLMIPAGASSLTFYWREVDLGSPCFVFARRPVSPPIVRAGTPVVRQCHTIVSGPSALAFTSSPQQVGAGECSAPLTIEAQDVAGLAAPVGSDEDVVLTSDSPTVGYFADASCTAPITQLRFGAGTSTAQVFFSDTGPGSVELLATRAGWRPARQQHELVAGPARSLVASGFPSPVRSGEPGSLLVTAYDAWGNVADGYAGTVEFFSSDAQAHLPRQLQFERSGGILSAEVTFVTPGTHWIEVRDVADASLQARLENIVVELEAELPAPEPAETETRALTVVCGCTSGSAALVEGAAVFALLLLARSKSRGVRARAARPSSAPEA